jgi:hypothetical protein
VGATDPPDEVEYKRGQLERQDAQSGYTPAKREQTEEVVPGDVKSNGLFGAPPKVTAPTIKSAYRDIPASYDVTKSQPYAIEMAKEGERQHARDEHLADEKTMADYRENLRSKRPNRGATGDSPSSTRRRRCAHRSTKSISGLKRSPRKEESGTRHDQR